MSEVPDHTAVRVALWRALHVEVEAAPHALDDVIGLQLAAPDENWRQRPDMHPEHTKLFRASIVARARFIEDLVLEKKVGQYVLLGAGLDTFVQRRPEASRIRVFEVDQPGTQAWKRKRLLDLGLKTPEFVPVDFEAGQSWWKRLVASGFDATEPAVVASTGVSMYLSREANMSTLREVAGLAPGSTFVMTYILPMEMADPEEKFGREMAEKGARAAGTPFISFFTSDQITALARECGFKTATTVSAGDLNRRYFSGRKDGFHTSKSEEILAATT